MEQVHPQFEEGLVIGKYNEKVIGQEFAYQGIPLNPTVGKDNVDFYLPDGRSIEVKIDLKSQCTGYGAIEWPTVLRNADFYIQTLTYARVFTHQQFKDLYMSGKKPAGGMGDLNYEGRLIKDMGKHGIPLWQFIKNLKNEN